MQRDKELKKLQKSRESQKKKVEKSYKKYINKYVKNNISTPNYEKRYNKNVNELNKLNNKLNNNASKTLMREKGLLGKNKAMSLLNEIERKGKNMPNIPQNIKYIISNQLKTRPKIDVTRELVSNFKKYPFHIQKKIETLLYKTNTPVKNIMNYDRLKNIMITINTNTNKTMHKPAKVSSKLLAFNNQYRKLYNNGSNYRNIQFLTGKLNNAYN